MTAQFFEHDRLDVYRRSIDYVARSCETSQMLEELHRHARDHWLRAAQSIPHRMVAMRARMTIRFDRVVESNAE